MPFVQVVWPTSTYDPADLVVDFTTTTASETVRLPIGSINVTIDWGDGSAPEATTTDNPEHTYASAGSYMVQVSGTATKFGNLVFPDVHPATYTGTIKGVRNWGTLGFTTFADAFRDVTANVVVPSNIPSTVTSLSDMFRSASAFNRDLSGWNVSNVTILSSTFRYATVFNSDISGWNTTGVTSMVNMFQNAEVFNQDVSGWDYRDMSASTRLDNFLQMTTGAFSVANYGLLLGKWASYIAGTEILSTMTPTVTAKYPSSAAANRAALVTYGWDITDSGEDV